MNKNEHQIIFLRHGKKLFDPKTANTMLTPEGKAESHRIGELIKCPKLIVFTGEQARHRQTGQLILESSSSQTKSFGKTIEYLSFHYSKKFFRAIRNLNSHREQTEFYLNFGKQPIDHKTKNPFNVYKGIEKWINKIQDEIPGTVVNITSDFNLSAYIFYKLGLKINFLSLEGFRVAPSGLITILENR